VGWLAGLSDLREVMRNKRIRWAASVYGRHLPEQRQKVEEILREVIKEDSQLRWMKEYQGARVVRVEGLDANAVKTWTDGSRVKGRAAGATRKAGTYLDGGGYDMGILRHGDIG